ncbi:MAG: hypothetical protein IT373_30895 [Polyangiaceae bacterium]|nr:hypothetical protein [Polyangiaceae bacterium]
MKDEAVAERHDEQALASELAALAARVREQARELSALRRSLGRARWVGAGALALPLVLFVAQRFLPLTVTKLTAERVVVHTAPDPPAIELAADHAGARLALRWRDDTTVALSVSGQESAFDMVARGEPRAGGGVRLASNAHQTGLVVEHDGEAGLAGFTVTGSGPAFYLVAPTWGASLSSHAGEQPALVVTSGAATARLAPE